MEIPFILHSHSHHTHTHTETTHIYYYAFVWLSVRARVRCAYYFWPMFEYLMASHTDVRSAWTFSTLPPTNHAHAYNTNRVCMSSNDNVDVPQKFEVYDDVCLKISSWFEKSISARKCTKFIIHDDTQKIVYLIPFGCCCCVMHKCEVNKWAEPEHHFPNHFAFVNLRRSLHDSCSISPLPYPQKLPLIL